MKYIIQYDDLPPGERNQLWFVGFAWKCGLSIPERWLRLKFLNCLYGSACDSTVFRKSRAFLSCLCGSELTSKLLSAVAIFLSCLYGSELALRLSVFATVIAPAPCQIVVNCYHELLQTEFSTRHFLLSCSQSLCAVFSFRKRCSR